VVLAEHAAEVAAAEEDRAGAAPAAQAVLLPKGREVRRDDRQPPHAAESGLIAEPVDLAQARADATAILEQRERAMGAVVELAGRVERKVGRLVVAHVRSVTLPDLEVTRVAQRR
jgi:hypothetical protein